jgi:hypothetical protein
MNDLSFERLIPVALSWSFISFLSPIQSNAGPAQQINELTGNKPTRVVWADHQGGDVWERPGCMTKLYYYDTQTDAVRQICPGNNCDQNSYAKPLFSPDGNRVIYSVAQQNAVYIVDLSGANASKITDGFGTCVRTIDGTSWVYVEKQDHGPLNRYNIDNPSDNQLVYDKTQTGICCGNGIYHQSWFAVSGDGKRAADGFPWPSCGLVELPSGNKIKDHGGCWTCVAPDNSYRWWVFSENHDGVALHVDGGDQYSFAPLNGPFGGGDMYFPKWSANDPRFVVISGPGIGNTGANAYIGKFNDQFSSIAQWVQVTTDNPGVFYPDAIIGYGAAGNPKVSTPQILPDQQTFDAPIQVTISCATEGAAIYYTTDGTDPSDQSTRCSTPFTLSESATVKALALKQGMDPSSVAQKAYTYTGLAAPKISPEGGTFTDSVVITLSGAPDGGTTRYTTDGAEPTDASTLYSAPFVLRRGAIIKARCFKSAMNPSAVTSASFIINYSKPGLVLLTPKDGDIVRVGQVVPITWEADLNRVLGVVIELSLDNGKSWEILNDTGSILPHEGNWQHWEWTPLEPSSTAVLKISDYFSKSLFDKLEIPLQILPVSGDPIAVRHENPMAQQQYLRISASVGRIAFSSGSHTGSDCSTTLFSAGGKQVARHNFGNTGSFDVPPGLYFAEIRTANNKMIRTPVLVGR